MRIFLIILIRGYKLFLSPIMGNSCRFYPSCSSYGIEALEKHGVFKGCYLTFNRICRCNPLGKSGYDPVPDALDKTQE